MSPRVDDELRRRVGEAPVARLATVRPDGRPHVVPICFALDGETLYTAVDRKPKRSRDLQRLANVRSHPQVEVLVDHYEDDWEKLWWVRLRGRGRILEPGREYDRALALLASKYRQYREQPPPGPVLAIDLDGWRGWRHPATPFPVPRTTSTTGAPTVAAWRHVSARDGFEVVFQRPVEDDGHVLEGHAAAVEAGEAWGIRYAVSVDSSWTTRSAHVVCHSTRGSFETRLAADGAGQWEIDGHPAPMLDGCLDVDLEASACTNALPVRRLALKVGASADAPAAYVRASDLRVERLEQRYVRLPDDGGRLRFDYASPAFAYRDVLVYDDGGLVLDYPGLAERIV